MPLAKPRQYGAMLDAAADGGYAYAAINVSSSETLNAALRGFTLANAGGIVQISIGAAEYMSGTTAKDALLGARAFARYAHVVAEASPDHPQDVTVSEYRHSAAAAQLRQSVICASADLTRALATGTAVAPEVPAGVAQVNLSRGQAFVIAVVPFAQVVAKDSLLPISG